MKNFGRNFGHPIAVAALALILSLLTCSWEMGLVVFGIELIMLRNHHRRFFEHRDSPLDHDWVAAAGVLAAFFGACLGMSSYAPLWALGAVMLICSTQLFSVGLHDEVHGDDSDSPLKIAAGLIVSIAVAFGLPLLKIIPVPHWQYWLV